MVDAEHQARPPRKRAVQVHLTNVTGTGAVRLAESLLPALMNSRVAAVSAMYLPARGPLAALTGRWPGVPAVAVRRRLPNAASRLIECAFRSRLVRGDDPVLVLGDLPLRCSARQTLFVQTPHLISADSAQGWRDKLKFAVSRWVLRANLAGVDTVIVQTDAMRDAMARAHPAMAGKLRVVAQPVPEWLLAKRSTRNGPSHDLAEGLQLAYPAAAYPHKNHGLLRGLKATEAASWGVSRLTLTLAAEQNPAPQVSWVRTVGALDPVQMLALYAETDALLFLSLQESYGFPLIEAMYVGLPIVCADRPYARALCGSGALYFDPGSIESLRNALSQLTRQLRGGWWPDWRQQLLQLPADWQAVADAMLSLALAADETRHEQDARP